MTSPKTVTPDQPRAVPDGRLWWFLHVLDACGKHGAHANDEPGEWVAAFCGDVEPKDTFNRACDLKLAGWSHNTMDETSRVWITDAGKAWLAARPVLPVETPAEETDGEFPLRIYLMHPNDAGDEGQCWSADGNFGGEFPPALYLLAPAPLSGRDGSLLEAIRFVEKPHDAYAREFGVYDPSTNATEFSGAAEDVGLTYAEILDGLRALATVPPETAEMEGE